MQNVELRPNKRMLYPDILRIMAVFAVMMTHICGYGFFNYDVSSLDWQIVNAFDCLTRWAVPVFLMVSGMFFLDPQKEITIQKLYRKNITRIFVALLFWGGTYQLANIFKRIVFENINSDVAIADAVKAFVLGPAWYHLWFLYLIIGLYIFVPLIRIFTKNATEKHYQYLFILFFVFGCAIPLLQEFLLCAHSKLNTFFDLKEFPGYCCYFILGYYLSKRDVSKRTKKCIYLMAFISVFVQFTGTSLISCKLGQANEILHRYFTPNVAVQAIAAFLFIKDIGTRFKIPNKGSQFIGLLGKYSFGMYLVHDFFNGIFYRIGFSSMNIPPIFDIPLRTLATFISSFLIVCLLAKIPIIKKYCM